MNTFILGLIVVAYLLLLAYLGFLGYKKTTSASDYLGASFEGFVADLQGKPAVYSSDFTLEDDEYNATISRWTLDEKGNWESDELCDVSLSEFLNNKYEQKE